MSRPMRPVYYKKTTPYKTTMARAVMKPKFVRGAKPGYAQIASVVRGMGLKGETKAIDLPNTGATLSGNITIASGNPTSKSLTLVQEGSGFWNRIGRKVCMKSLQLTGWINFLAGGASANQELIRYIIFYDKQPNGVAATWNQIVQAYDNAGTATNLVTDGINLDNRDRFVILRDRKVMYTSYSDGSGQPGILSTQLGVSVGSIGTKGVGSDGGMFVSEFIKLPNYEAQFNGTANPATVAQISTGNLGIVFAGNVGNQYSLIASARLRFTDC